MKLLVIVFALLWLFSLSPPFAIFIASIYFLYLIIKSIFGDGSVKNKPLNSGDLADLTILRMEIERLQQECVLNAEQAESYRKQVDSVIGQYLAECSAEPDNVLWRERKEIAWSLLARYSGTELGLPPWKPKGSQQAETESAQPPVFVKELPEETEIVFPVEELSPPDKNGLKAEKDEEAIEPACLTEQEQLQQQASPSEFVRELQDDTPQIESITEPDQLESPTPTPFQKTESPVLQQVVNESSSNVNQAEDMQDYAWQPKEPGVLEKMLTGLSGWHALAAPFLLQNIGWFIGVFCFIAGSIFLVSYSSGYAKNLIAFITLFIFTLFALWGGYQIRRKRPELKTSSHVIFILGMLMIPLVTTTGINLQINSEGIGLKLLSGALLTVELAAFSYAVTIVSALMDRSLQRRFPLYFLSLNVSQLLLFPLALWSYWFVAMLAHLLVFVVLGLGIHNFIHDWLQSIFLDRRKITYFAAGTLIYAALIAFINFTWWTHEEINFPAGYSGFFLMLLCGVLFYVDSHFKQWAERQAYLSRFSFVVYGLSVLALFIEMPQQSMAVPTLCVAIALYAFVVWHYLTLTPLYIFLLCSFWLYGLLILQHFSPDIHFMLAFPGLYALYRSAKWALNVRRCRYLAIIVYRMLYALLTILAIWSLFHSEQGWLGLGNVLLACGLLYFSLASAPVWLFQPPVKIDQPFVGDRYNNLLMTPWFYGIPVLLALAVFYMPILPGFQAEIQQSFALILLVIYWAYGGLKLFFNGNRKTPSRLIEMRLNAALLSLSLALLLTFAMPVIAKCLILALTGGFLLGGSLLLRVRWLFYLTMLCWAITGMLIKQHYFPAPSTGLMETLTALMIWGLLWWLERPRDDALVQLQRQAEQARVALLPSFRLLWFWPVNAKQEGSDD